MSLELEDLDYYWNINSTYQEEELLPTALMMNSQLDEHENCTFDVNVCGNLTEEYKMVMN